MKPGTHGYSTLPYLPRRTGRFASKLVDPWPELGTSSKRELISMFNIEFLKYRHTPVI